MMPMNDFKRGLTDLARGIWRGKLKFLGYVFAMFSMLFTVVKMVDYFVPGVMLKGKVVAAVMVLIAFVGGVRKVWKPSKISMPIAHTNTCFEILFGDLFQQPGIRAIAVTEYFDSQIGRPVSDKSLHGMLIQNVLGGHTEAFDRSVDEELRDAQGQTTAKKEGKNKAFPIGTTALIPFNQDRYLLFAMTRADVENCKANADVTDMWKALHAMWQRARIESGGHDVNIPLVGGGLSGIGLPARDLLNLLILSAITETKSKEITQTIRIVLHRNLLAQIDLRDVKKYWEEK